MDLKLPKPGFWMGAVLALMVVGIQISLSIPLALIDELFTKALQLPAPGLPQNPWAISLVNIIAFGGAIALGLVLNRLSFWKAYAFSPPRLLQIICMIVMVLGADVLLSEADNVFRSVLPPPEFLREALKEVFSGEGDLISRIFLLVVVAPITEELLFRGLILRGLLSRFSPTMAILLTGLLFGAVHVNPWQFISATCLGLIFGWLYVRTGKLLLAILAHALSNGIFVAVSAMSFDVPGLTTEPEPGHVVFQPWWLDLSGLAALSLAAFAFHLLTRKTLSMPETVQDTNRSSPR